MASTISSSLEELTVTPNDSDVIWRSDGILMTDHLLVTSIDITFISKITNRNDVNRSDKQMVSH